MGPCQKSKVKERRNSATNVISQEKISKYWPNLSQTLYYGNLGVQCSVEEKKTEWTARTFIIVKVEYWVFYMSRTSVVSIEVLLLVLSTQLGFASF